MKHPHLNGDDHSDFDEEDEFEEADPLQDVLDSILDSIESIDAKLDVIMSQTAKIK